MSHSPTVHIYLASTSPRRRDLLTRAGYRYECVEPGPEPEADGEPRAVAIARARGKCVEARVPTSSPNGCVLGVDTVVDVDGEEFGKPRDRHEAQRMLLALAGREHAVHSAHCLRPHPGERVFERVTTARVFVRKLTAAEIDAYLTTEDWRDKAGGYGIQSHAGAFCSLVQGDLGTVIGLSIPALKTLLHEAGGGPPRPVSGSP